MMGTAKPPIEIGDQRFSSQVSRLRRVRSPRMMVMKKYSEAISQEKIVGNSSLKELFLHVAR